MDRSPATLAIWAVAAVLALVAAARLLAGGESEGQPVRLAGGASAGAVGGSGRAPGAAGRARVVVHVAGAVRAPGLYRLAADARVAAALERAGGPAARADLNAVNLAARVQDGQQIVVPRAGAVAHAGAEAGAGTGQVKPSLGSASAQQLEELDGIGPTLAERIVEYRGAHGGFRSLDELAEVDGIGEQRLKSLREALQP